jgi:hypothetical protein
VNNVDVEIPGGEGKRRRLIGSQTDVGGAPAAGARRTRVYIRARFAIWYTARPAGGRELPKEPVGTEAEFFVISVNHNELEALRKHQVVDNGILKLPPGAQVESVKQGHVKTSQ